MLDYIRIACAVPEVKVGDVTKNVGDICRKIEEAEEQKCDLVVFPELAVSGYTCADLFFQERLLEDCRKGLQIIAEQTRKFPDVTVVAP